MIIVLNALAALFLGCSSVFVVAGFVYMPVCERE
jgi:hypothetical protein